MAYTRKQPLASEQERIRQMAIFGYQSEIQRMQTELAALQQGPQQQQQPTTSALPLPKKRHTMSASARKRIGAAQKARWAAFKKQKQQK